MVCEQLYLLEQPIGIKAFKLLDELRMQRCSANFKNGAVGNLADQPVLESVSEFREQSRFVKKFRREKATESCIDGLLGLPIDSLQKGERNVLTDDSRRL